MKVTLSNIFLKEFEKKKKTKVRCLRLFYAKNILHFDR